ncbi:cadherin EGF LAG seven-pass G-type receptor fmi-1-like isoform X2 [Liolophura sinensis]|uniref:cadherin EGF LAG seven-pass G-type receptor fmi-1-like isoform X2 n=1 Tax=Liolophura sinensis TaxID=3198878 RepID=UPI0031586223
MSFLSLEVCGGSTSGQDTSPLFIRTLYSGVCREGTAVDTAILTVTAFDADPGPAGIIDYTLQENNLFKIDDRGAVRVKSPIDAENPDVGDVMTYIVTATDRGTPKRSGTTNLSIQIVDENEARPRFEKFLYFADVYQNDQIGTVILTPKAHDRDRDATLVYDMFILSPYFHIDNRTGTVMVDKAIDYKEVVEFYRGRSVFQVKARVTDGRYLSIVTIVTRVHTSERGLNNLLTTTQPPPTTTAPGCTIEGRRYTDGDRNPENNCEVCQMDVNPTSWTPTLIPLRAGIPRREVGNG